MSNEDFYDLLHQSRILVVDDDEDMCNLVKKFFESEGYPNVEMEKNGTEAVRKITAAVADKNPYSLVMLDLRLQEGMSGRDVYETIAANLDVPIIVVSAVSERDSIIEALKSGRVEEYVVKPFDLEVLFLKCERIISRRLYSKHMQQSNRRNQMLFLNILQVMAKVLEAKDPYTKFHSEKVAKYSRQIAKRAGYNERQLELIQIAGILHDFGKIGIKESVLNKPGSLTKFEYEAVKRHPLIASAILEPIEELRVIIRDIRHHHEWYNGEGYPDGLEAENIPMGARILCVADSFDAMTSSRSYHEPMSEDAARDELIRCKGMQFDPELVDMFIDVLDENRKRRERIIRLREELS
ncbi:MAG: response regulator [Planctomycetes bacterium]|nr:response regulator [Planctomycetota bacterium]